MVLSPWICIFPEFGFKYKYGQMREIRYSNQILFVP